MKDDLINKIDQLIIVDSNCGIEYQTGYNDGLTEAINTIRNAQYSEGDGWVKQPATPTSEGKGETVEQAAEKHTLSLLHINYILGKKIVLKMILYQALNGKPNTPNHSIYERCWSM